LKVQKYCTNTLWNKSPYSIYMNYHNKHLSLHPMQLDVQFYYNLTNFRFSWVNIVEFSTSCWKEMNNVIMFIMLLITTRNLQSKFLFWKMKIMTKGLIPKPEKYSIGFFKVMFINNIIIYAYPFIHNKLFFFISMRYFAPIEVYMWFKCNNLQLNISIYI
jgi:hypothetical protein